MYINSNPDHLQEKAEEKSNNAKIKQVNHFLKLYLNLRAYLDSVMDLSTSSSTGP